ncbi:MAG: hypothetical protein ACLQGV_11900 [Bryobacteraceae bacterium]
MAAQIRCEACGRVVKVKGELACPLCGQALPAAFFSPGVGGGPWEELPTQRMALSFGLWMLIELLIIALFFWLAFKTAGNEVVFLLLSLLVFICTITVGIRLEHKTIRRENLS